jgi:hypothetical protein
MVEIDHVCLGSKNIFEAAHRYSQETGLGYYDGGWFPNFGLANRIVPCGGDVYIEIEGAVDVHAYEQGNRAARFFHENCAAGDVFIGWCARVDSRAELEQIAKRLNTDVFESGMRVRPGGACGVSARAPDTFRCWKAGLPNFFYVQDMAGHPSRQPASFGSATPQGVAWMELGGTEDEMSDYLGVKASSLGLRFNGGQHGLHAMGIKTSKGEVVIRLPPIAGATGKLTEDQGIPSTRASYVNEARA